MRVLLDTHIWLWSEIDPSRLAPGTLKVLKDPQNEIWLSPISTWEALTLHNKGTITLFGDLAEWIRRATSGIKEAIFTHEIALVARELPLHKDPSDRMIAATAQVFDLTLVTADERLH